MFGLHRFIDGSIQRGHSDSVFNLSRQNQPPIAEFFPPMFFLPDRIAFPKVQSKYGSSNELLMHFMVRERRPSDCLRGQEKLPQNAKSLFLDPLGALSNPQTPRQYNICPHLFVHFFLLLKLFLKTLSE